MKKSIKILSLVLALALVCGALVVGAFAKVASDLPAADGVYVVTGADLNAADTTILIKGTDVDDPEKPANKTTTLSSGTGKRLTADIINRHGILQVVKSEYEENIYVTYAPGAVQKANGGPFISTGYNAHDKMKDTLNSDTFTYQVYDIDVFFPAGKTVSFTANVQVRGYAGEDQNKADGSKTSVASGINIFTLYSEDKAADNVTLKNAKGDAIMQLPTTEWTHITNVLEVKLVDGVKNVYITTFVNGEAVDTVFVTNEITETKKINSDDKDKTKCIAAEWWFSETRYNFTTDHSGDAYRKDASIAMDNFSWRGFNPTSYANIGELQAVLAAGEGADLSAWTDSLYNEAEMPFGTLSATVTHVEGEGEEAITTTTKYDNLAKAIAAAKAGDIVTLNASSTETIVVDKAITVKKNGFTAELVNEEVKKTETDEAYIFEATNVKLNVKVNACACGNGCIEQKTIAVYDGANIWDAIVAAYGKEPTCSYQEGETQYVFDGFTITGTAASLFEGGVFNKDAVVTEAFAKKTLILNATYKVTAPIAKVFKADGTLVTTYYEGDANFQTMLGKVDNYNGGKIVFYADFTTDQTNIKYFSRSVTVDLNGYTLKHLCSPDATAKTNDNAKALFQPKAGFTLMSSKVGAKIFEAALYKTNNRNGVPVIAAGAHDTCEINIIGRNDAGETTISYWGNEIVQSYGYRAKVNIDGGYYCRNRHDNYALVDLRVLSDSTFKNATFEGAPIFAFCGRTAGMTKDGALTTANVTIDNCVLLASDVIKYVADPVTVNITNSVIGGNMTLSSEGSAKAATGDEVIIGKGCKLASTFTAKVNYAADVLDVNEVLTYKTMQNDWTVGADNFALTEVTTNVTVAKVVAEPINVTLTKDGKEFAVKTAAGVTATVELGEVEGTKGMVNASAAVKIPADAKDGDVIAIPDDAEIIYTAGKVPMQFSMTITGHTSYNFIVPVVDGIEYVEMKHDLPGYGPVRPVSGALNRTDAAGNKYKVFQTWPGMYLVDESGAITITYTYEGVQLATTVKASFGALDYAEYIIKGETQSKELKGVVANLVYTANKYDAIKGTNVTERIKTLLASDEFKAAYVEYVAPTGVSNAAAYAKMAEEGKIQEIALIAKAGNTGLTVGIKENGDYGFKMTTKEAYEFGCALVGDWRRDNTGYFFMHNIRAYAFNNDFVIEVYEAFEGTGSVKFTGEPIATYEWTLAGYINDNAEKLAGTDALAYAKAIYSYAESAQKYLEWKQANGLDMNF